VNDFMVSAANVDFSATDRMFVCVGVTKKSDAALGAVLCQDNPAATNGAWEFSHSSTSGDVSGRTWRMLLRNVASSTESAYVYAAPITNVLSSLMNFSQSTGDTQIDLRVNGGAPTSKDNTNGANAKAAFNSGLVYIASRIGTSVFSSANIYQLIAVGKTPTTSELNQTETFVAAKTKGSLA
jgi:hypothetical protein